MGLLGHEWGLRQVRQGVPFNSLCPADLSMAHLAVTANMQTILQDLAVWYMGASYTQWSHQPSMDEEDMQMLGFNPLTSVGGGGGEEGRGGCDVMSKTGIPRAGLLHLLVSAANAG